MLNRSREVTMSHRIYPLIGLVLVFVAGTVLSGCTRSAETVRTFEIEAVIQAQGDRLFTFDARPAPAGISYWKAGDPLVLRDRSLFPLLNVNVPPPETTEEVAQEYTITRIEVREQVDDGWEVFSEFPVTKEYATDIGVVIILDNSRSLQNLLDQNRQLAARLARELIEDPRAENRVAVAIAPLAVRANDKVTFTTKASEAEQRAYDVELYPYSPIYDTIGQAIELFSGYEAVARPTGSYPESGFQFEEKIIVLISDGQDDNSHQESPGTISQKLDGETDVYVLAVADQDPLHEPRLLKLAGPDRYRNLSAMSTADALEQMTEVKNAILLACRDRFNLYYERSNPGPGAVHRVKFVITAEPKSAAPPAATTDDAR